MADDLQQMIVAYHCDQCHKRIEGSPSVKDAKQAAAVVDEGLDELFRKLGPPDA